MLVSGAPLWNLLARVLPSTKQQARALFNCVAFSYQLELLDVMENVFTRARPCGHANLGAA